jgi:2-dehydropantoate 2-reductase
MGAGAVGGYFGGLLARAGAPVTFIGRPAFVEAVNTNGLLLDTLLFQERVAVRASTEASAVRDADIVLFCVKTLDTDSAARAMAPHLLPQAIVASLQNGVDNVERIHAAAGIDALPCVVYVAAAMPAPGHVKHSGRGDLAVGHASRAADVKRFAQTFERAGVKCRISENIAGDLWGKLVWNCAGNALTALGRASYGQVAASEFGRALLLATANEVMDVARAAGVTLPPIDLASAGLKLARDLGPATSSTAQDIQRGKRTEIDSLNGYVVRCGAELGVPTPINQTLYALVKLVEENLASG